MVSRLFFISTNGPMAVQMSFVGHTNQVVIIAESFMKKSVFPGAPLYSGIGAKTTKTEESFFVSKYGLIVLIFDIYNYF